MRIRFIAILGLFASSCGVPDTSQLKNISPNDRLLVFAMGGRSSCGPNQSPKSMSMYPRLERLVDILREKHSVELVSSCFDRSANLFFEASNQVRPGKSEDLSGIANSVEKDKVLLIGHSYGGWLAMRTVLDLKTKVHLYTIDPISPIDCELTKPTSWLGCQRAPKDIPAETVAARAVDWVHFYQDTTPYLHSSSIPLADNKYIQGVGHTKIDESQQVWTDIKANLLE